MLDEMGGRAGTTFGATQEHRFGTLIVVWDDDLVDDLVDPCMVLTGLALQHVGVSWYRLWYGLRMWIELGFRILKGAGWQRTRRTDP